MGLQNLLCGFDSRIGLLKPLSLDTRLFSCYNVAMSKENDERLWNLMIWKVPLTNEELFGKGRSGPPPEAIAIMLVIALVLFIIAAILKSVGE